MTGRTSSRCPARWDETVAASSWLVRWLVVALVGTWLFTTAYFAIADLPGVLAGERGLAAYVLSSVVAPLWAMPLLAAAFVLPMTLVAAAVRALWQRLGPRPWRAATVPAVLGGLASGPLAMLLITVPEALGRDGGVAVTLFERWLRDDLAFSAPLLAGGAAAGYLAHRRVPVRSPWWWLVVVGAVAAGLALLAPTDPTLSFDG
jgi:hypothetical protein